MHCVLDSIYFKGTIVINKGTRMSSPELALGDGVGCGDNPQIDIALDPLECTESVAFGRSNAMAVILMAPSSQLMAVPEIYMEKIAVGPEAAGVIDLNSSVEDNIIRIAKVKNYKISDLTVVILDRERHQELIKRVRRMGARIHLIPDGDVAGAVATALPGTGIDVLMGIGGASEGVLAAGALRCFGGEFQARFVPTNKDEIEMAQKMGITDIRHIYHSEELAQGDSIMFAATGVTDGDLLNGVRYRPDGATTHSLVMRSKTKTRRFIVTDHFFEGKPEY
jgi:fructose-1,6-bisphosphatase II